MNEHIYQSGRPIGECIKCDGNFEQCLNKVIEDQRSSYVQNPSLSETRPEVLPRVSAWCAVLSCTLAPPPRLVIAIPCLLMLNILALMQEILG